MVAELKALQAHKKKPISPTRLQNGKKKKRRSAKRRQVVVFFPISRLAWG